MTIRKSTDDPIINQALYNLIINILIPRDLFDNNEVEQILKIDDINVIISQKGEELEFASEEDYMLFIMRYA